MQHNLYVYQVSDPGGEQQGSWGVPFQAAAGERSLAEVTLRAPAPSSTTPGLCSAHSPGHRHPISALHAAPPHDKGALLIIGDGVLTRVMTA